MEETEEVKGGRLSANESIIKNARAVEKSAKKEAEHGKRCTLAGRSMTLKRVCDEKGRGWRGLRDRLQ